MTSVLVKVFGGIVDEAIFFEDENFAIKELEHFVKTMNPEDEDAWVFGANGMIANAKSFLDENDQFIEDVDISAPEQIDKPLYIIGNPNHFIGFMVASPDDPLAYKDPVEALSELGQMRKEFGRHLKMYRLTPVVGVMATRMDLEQHNTQCDVDDFNYSLIEEYL